MTLDELAVHIIGDYRFPDGYACSVVPLDVNGGHTLATIAASGWHE